MEKKHVKQMFSAISPTYDLLNAVLSLRRDAAWRRFAVSKLGRGRFLDLCCGTGDIALEIIRQKKGEVFGVDFSIQMLKLARIKARGDPRVTLCQQDGENLAFRDETFDGAIIAFGIRNIPHKKKALEEMRRVVKKNGRIIILEFSKPQTPIFRNLYNLYFNRILPLMGRLISRDKKAYHYLPNSVMHFPTREKFVQLMEEAGIKKIEYTDLTWGIVTIYQGKR